MKPGGFAERKRTGMNMIRENLTDVERRIKEACLRCGREPSSVRLIAVSKTKPAEMIQEAIAAGILDFGENKPQELRDKYDILLVHNLNDIHWRTANFFRIREQLHMDIYSLQEGLLKYRMRISA